MRLLPPLTVTSIKQLVSDVCTNFAMKEVPYNQLVFNNYFSDKGIVGGDIKKINKELSWNLKFTKEGIT